MTDPEISVFSAVSKRVCIWACYNKGLSIREAQRDLQMLFQDQAPGYGTIQFWFSEFAAGRTIVSDSPRPGRPRSQDLDDAVCRMVEQDPHISARAISLELGVARDTVLNILHNTLGLDHYHLRWVPHALTQAQKAIRVAKARDLLDNINSLSSTGLSYLLTSDESWFMHSNPHSSAWSTSRDAAGTVPSPTLTREKTMIIVFWNFSGFFFITALPRGATYSADYVCEVLLPELETAVRAQRPVLGLKRTKIHWDNARPHFARKTAAFLGEKEAITLSHPPYSPDIAPSDFFLFGYLKHLIKGRNFASSDELIASLREIYAMISKDMLMNVLRGWKERLSYVIENNGEYYH